MSLNFLLCFDSDYNKQAEVSIFSLLEKCNEKIEINIIHKSEESSKFISDKILNHKNLKELRINKFYKPKNIKFENLLDAHVSEATYYRLFLHNYIDNSLDNLIYLDCDIVCVQNPLEILNKYVGSLKNSEYIVGAVPEYKKSQKDHVEIYHKELKLNSNDYFNAGVMIIDYKKWVEKNTGEQLLRTLQNLKDRIKYWDQDVMNKLFDGEYLKLIDGLNKKFTNIEVNNQEILDEIKNKNSNNYFIHFAGKFKPWQVSGTVITGSELFQNNYEIINNANPYIQIKNRRNSTKQLFSFLFLKRLLKNENRLNILYKIISEIILKRNIS